MKSNWFVLIISALTDFIIVAGTALTSAMMAKGTAEIPTAPILLLVAIGGTMAMARTIQQGIRSEITEQTSLVTPAPISSSTTVKITDIPKA